MSRGSRILDRYLLRQFFRIFGLCVLGVPFIFIVIDLTDRIDNYLAEGAAVPAVVLHYLYQFPYQALLAFPIASLLAAVFTVSSMTRNFEVTAAKAGGVSFYRLVAPLLGGAFAVSLVALGLTEVVPAMNRKADEVLGEAARSERTIRTSFVFRAKEGRVYEVQRLDAPRAVMSGVGIEREGTGYAYPTYSVHAKSATWDSVAHHWVLRDGWLRFLPEPATTRAWHFEELWQRAFTESPTELLAEAKNPEEMGFAELGRFIEAIQRSGGSARELIVQRWLKIAFPFTCFIIVLFGTPLANSTRRGGAPLSVGIALATTVLFLILIRIAQAMGAGGVVPPELAAWLPNALFLTTGLVLLQRVRT